jgi:UDP-glucose 4-epimerase
MGLDRRIVESFNYGQAAAVFSEPDYVPIDEAHPNRPVNPYGRSKWMVEQTLTDLEAIIAYAWTWERKFSGY